MNCKSVFFLFFIILIKCNKKNDGQGVLNQPLIEKSSLFLWKKK
jgi:hypothetical protein